MAETDTSTAPDSGSSPMAALGMDSPATKELTGKLADNTRNKIAAEDKVLGGIEATQARLLPRIEKLADNAGVEAEKMKPWNAEQESAKHRTDPIAAFGSFGSVFGILASAFTHAPMENALNASAASMNALRANDDKEYTRAYQAWQDNTKQALDRHKITQDAYQDATSLLSTNMAAANTKLQVLASRFGDKQVLTLLEAGMSKEVQDVLQSRQRMALELQQNLPKIALENEKMRDLMEDPRMKQPVASPERAQAIREHAERWAPVSGRSTPMEMIARKIISENPDASSEEITQKISEAAKSMGGGGAAGHRTPKPEEAEINRLRDEKIKAGMEPTKAYQEAVQEAKRAAVVPSAKLTDDLSSKISRTEYMEDTINKVESMLKKHKAIVGLGGAVTRPAESISNIFGSDDTDRRQMERWILELQEWAPRVLNDSAGRPLSSEAAKVNGIIAGLRWGDTVQNTARAYAELRPLIKTIRTDLQKRRDGSKAAPETGAKPDAKKPAWEDYPVVQ